MVLTAVTLVAGLAWTWIAAAATGVPDAYLRDRGRPGGRSWMGDSAFALFTPWWFAAHFWAERAVGSAGADVVAALLLVVVVGGFVALLLSPAARRLGALNRLWVASYALYLLAVFFPQSSLFRLLMPMAPLTGALVPRRTAGPRSAARGVHGPAGALALVHLRALPGVLECALIRASSAWHLGVAPAVGDNGDRSSGRKRCSHGGDETANG